MNYTKPEHIKKHADAMAAIRAALAPFPPAEQMVMVAGILGDILCETGDNPCKASAIMLTGTAMEMVFDMIGRNFQEAA